MGLARAFICVVLAFLRPQESLADWESSGKNLSWIYDVKNPVTTQNQTYKLNSETGAFRYHFDISVVDTYKFESQSSDAVTLGCYGWKDANDIWHATNYVADTHGWRLVRDINQPIDVYPTFDEKTTRTFLDSLPQCIVHMIDSAPVNVPVFSTYRPPPPFSTQAPHHDDHVPHESEHVHHVSEPPPPYHPGRPGISVISGQPGNIRVPGPQGSLSFTSKHGEPIRKDGNIPLSPLKRPATYKGTGPTPTGILRRPSNEGIPPDSLSRRPVGRITPGGLPGSPLTGVSITQRIGDPLDHEIIHAASTEPSVTVLGKRPVILGEQPNGETDSLITIQRESPDITVSRTDEGSVPGGPKVIISEGAIPTRPDSLTINSSNRQKTPLGGSTRLPSNEGATPSDIPRPIITTGDHPSHVPSSSTESTLIVSNDLQSETPGDTPGSIRLPQYVGNNQPEQPTTGFSGTRTQQPSNRSTPTGHRGLAQILLDEVDGNTRVGKLATQQPYNRFPSTGHRGLAQILLDEVATKDPKAGTRPISLHESDKINPLGSTPSGLNGSSRERPFDKTTFPGQVQTAFGDISTQRPYDGTAAGIPIGSRVHISGSPTGSPFGSTPLALDGSSTGRPYDKINFAGQVTTGFGDPSTHRPYDQTALGRPTGSGGPLVVSSTVNPFGSTPSGLDDSSNGRPYDKIKFAGQGTTGLGDASTQRPYDGIATGIPIGSGVHISGRPTSSPFGSTPLGLDGTSRGQQYDKTTSSVTVPTGLGDGSSSQRPYDGTATGIPIGSGVHISGRPTSSPFGSTPLGLDGTSRGQLHDKTTSSVTVPTGLGDGSSSQRPYDETATGIPIGSGVQISGRPTGIPFGSTPLGLDGSSTGRPYETTSSVTVATGLGDGSSSQRPYDETATGIPIGSGVHISGRPTGSPFGSTPLGLDDSSNRRPYDKIKITGQVPTGFGGASTQRPYDGTATGTPIGSGVHISGRPTGSPFGSTPLGLDDSSDRRPYDKIKITGQGTTGFGDASTQRPYDGTATGIPIGSRVHISGRPTGSPFGSTPLALDGSSTGRPYGTTSSVTVATGLDDGSSSQRPYDGTATGIPIGSGLQISGRPTGSPFGSTPLALDGPSRGQLDDKNTFSVTVPTTFGETSSQRPYDGTATGTPIGSGVHISGRPTGSPFGSTPLGLDDSSDRRPYDKIKITGQRTTGFGDASTQRPYDGTATGIPIGSRVHISGRPTGSPLGSTPLALDGSSTGRPYETTSSVTVATGLGDGSSSQRPYDGTATGIPTGSLGLTPLDLNGTARGQLHDKTTSSVKVPTAFGDTSIKQKTPQIFVGVPPSKLDPKGTLPGSLFDSGKPGSPQIFVGVPPSNLGFEGTIPGTPFDSTKPGSPQILIGIPPSKLGSERTTPNDPSISGGSDSKRTGTLPGSPPFGSNVGIQRGSQRNPALVSSETPNGSTVADGSQSERPVRPSIQRGLDVASSTPSYKGIIPTSPPGSYIPGDTLSNTPGDHTPKFQIPPGYTPVLMYIPAANSPFRPPTTDSPSFLSPPEDAGQFCSCSCPRRL